MMPVIYKCLVFDLPWGGGDGGAGGMAAGIMAAGIQKSIILKQLKAFSDAHGVDYRTKTHKQQLKVWFEQDNIYTLFFLVYNADKEWRRPYIIHERYDESSS